MFKVNRRNTIIGLIIVCIIGSLSAFYGTNLILNGILQKDLPFSVFMTSLLPGLAFFAVPLSCCLFIFFLLRMYLHPTHEKRMLFVYGISISSVGGLGFIFTTLSGAIMYRGNFLTNHPFDGFHILMYIYQIILIGLGLLMIFYFRNKVENEDIIIDRTDVRYVLRTALLSVIIFIALNRLGGFILSPVYIQWSSLSLTYPAYIALILPAIILINDLIYIFHGYKKSPVAGIVVSSFVVFFSLFFFAQILVRGMSDQKFIQLISPLNPIGRLLTFPYDTVLQMLVALGLAIFTLVNSVFFKMASDYNELAFQERLKKAHTRAANYVNIGNRSHRKKKRIIKKHKIK